MSAGDAGWEQALREAESATAELSACHPEEPQWLEAALCRRQQALEILAALKPRAEEAETDLARLEALWEAGGKALRRFALVQAARRAELDRLSGAAGLLRALEADGRAPQTGLDCTG